MVNRNKHISDYSLSDLKKEILVDEESRELYKKEQAINELTTQKYKENPKMNCQDMFEYLEDVQDVEDYIKAKQENGSSNAIPAELV